MSIPIDNQEPNKKAFNNNDSQGDFFKTNSYTNSHDVHLQPSNELVRGFHSQINPVTNPDEEFVQLANAGKFSNHLSKCFRDLMTPIAAGPPAEVTKIFNYTTP